MKSVIMRLNPSLIVGIGGTGYRTLANIKTRLMTDWKFSSVPPMIRLISIDTDQNEKIEAGMIDLDQSEKLHLLVDTGEVLRNIDQHPEILEWYPENMNFGSINLGARQVRALGRLAYFRCINDIRQVLEANIKAINALEHFVDDRISLPQNPQTTIYVVCSLCGGSGAGMFIDVAYTLRKILRGLNMQATDIHAYLLLPDAFSSVMKVEDARRLRANGYAALQELDYFMQGHIFEVKYDRFFEIDRTVTKGVPPFDYTYLLSGVKVDSLAVTEKMVAESIFHSIATDMGSQERSRLNNTVTQAKGPINTGKGDVFNGILRPYSSIGVSSAVFPVEKIINLLAATYGQKTIENYLTYDRKNQADREVDLFIKTKNYNEEGIENNDIIDFISQRTEAELINSKKYIKISKCDIMQQLALDEATCRKATDRVNKFMKENQVTLYKQMTRDIQVWTSSLMVEEGKGVVFARNCLENLMNRFKLFSDQLTEELETLEREKRKLSSSRTAKLEELEQVTRKTFNLFGPSISKLAGEYIEIHNQLANIVVCEIPRRLLAVELLNKIVDHLKEGLILIDRLIEVLKDLARQFNRDAHPPRNYFMDKPGDKLLNQSVVDFEDCQILYDECGGNIENPEAHFVSKEGLDMRSQWAEYARNPHIFASKVKEYFLGKFKAVYSKTLEGFLLEKGKRLNAAAPEAFIEQTLYNIASTAHLQWNINTNICSEVRPVELVLFGVQDASSTKFAAYFDRVGYRHGLKQNVVTTGDPYRITMIVSSHGAPAFVLSLIRDWEITYRQLRDAGEFLHAITEKQLEKYEKDFSWLKYPLYPEVGRKEGILWFSLGLATNFIELVQANYYSKNDRNRKVDIKSDKNLGKGRKQASTFLVEFQNERSAIQNRVIEFLESMPPEEALAIIETHLSRLTEKIREYESGSSELSEETVNLLKEESLYLREFVDNIKQQIRITKEEAELAGMKYN